ncbi:4302_t:CDS:2 [Gigaspora margarita]|uniref:4302_t:CDS:1 n=1 Tax=Gigaspora margarita TaxID=4874 RepID=A0ABN7W3J7_GIGMA|nr:4302_t:CDS:2 [Gigaspora margarita]
MFFNNPCAKTRQQAKALYDNINLEFILATKYLADILSIISKLTKIFQSDYIALSNVYMQLNIAIESILLEFIGYKDDNIALTFGYYLQEYINNTLEYNKLASIFKEFALAFIKNLYQRFFNITKVNRNKLLKEWQEAKVVLKNYKELGFVKE